MARSLWTAAWLASAVLGCRFGGADVPIGFDSPSTFYVSPLGDDRNPGTRQRPWATLPRATAALRPGHTLVLASGDYYLETTGLLQVDCDGRARQGKVDAPITIRAEKEREAALHGDGATPPLQLSGCAYWSIEGLVLTSEHDEQAPQGTDVGSIAMLRGGHDLTVRRLLLMRTNHWRHSHVLRILEAARVLVEECEAYDFYHNAFEAVRSEAVTFRRNYFHSRYATSEGNAVGTDDPTRGEIAIQVEESSAPLLENNLAEVVGVGFSVVARAAGSSYTDPSPYPVSGARLFGNLVADALELGFKVETRCNDAVPCAEPERIARDTLIVNGVVLGARTGFSIDAGPGTRVDNVTAVDVTDGLKLQRSAGNAGLDFSASAARALVRGYTGTAFAAEGAADWSFEHCAAEGPGPGAVAFSPNDERVRLPVPTSGGDACVAYLGAGSPLRGAAGAEGDVGARVVQRYVDGVLSAEPLWDPDTGAFPCGAVVPGINDDPSQSCIGAHERLRIGSGDCALPEP